MHNKIVTQHMESPFIYNTHVAYTNFLGRKDELTTLKTHILNRENTLLYGGPGTGKDSLILNTITEVKKTIPNIVICTIDMSNIRKLHEIAIELIAQIDNSFPEADLNKTAYYAIKKLIETNSDLEPNRYIELFETIDSIENISNNILIIYFKDFQHILLSDNPEFELRLLEKAFSKNYNTTYIITGNEVNAMKFIFEKKKYFYKFAYKITLSPIERRLFVDYISKCFLKVGRVIERTYCEKIYDLFNGHPYYVIQLASICFELTVGYFGDKILAHALDNIIAIHESYFKYMINNLSNYQLSFLKAINDGHDLFSSSDIISRYGLNSSANVFRVKEALCKKEIITFNDDDKPEIIDPLFRYWLKNIYFRY